MGAVNQSPYFAGIIAGSMLWVAYGWVTRLVKGNSRCHLSHDLHLPHRLWQRCQSIHTSTWLSQSPLVSVDTTSSEQSLLIRACVLGPRTTEN